MLHGLITVILLVITNKLGVILRLFVFVSVGFDLLVIASLFLFRFRLMGRKDVDVMDGRAKYLKSCDPWFVSRVKYFTL